jgi:hypothetical protein
MRCAGSRARRHRAAAAIPTSFSGRRGAGGGGAGQWGVWASASGGQWNDPCAIQYNAAALANNRYDNNSGYRRVRTRDTQREADLDIDHFGRYHRNQPDGVVKMVSCDPSGSGNNGGNNAGSGNSGGTNHRAWMTGTFDTGGGVMTLSPSGGNYAYQNGRMRVTAIDGPVMEGVWEQDVSAGRCDDGRYHGKFRLTFTESGFSGVFGYCDEVPSRRGGFQGTRRR